jgi:hypothetical protein
MSGIERGRDSFIWEIGDRRSWWLFRSVSERNCFMIEAEGAVAVLACNWMDSV